MRSQDQRYTVIELAENTSHVGIPSVAMNDIGIGPRGVKIEPLLETGEHALQFLWAGVAALINLVAFGG